MWSRLIDISILATAFTCLETLAMGLDARPMTSRVQRNEKARDLLEPGVLKAIKKKKRDCARRQVSWGALQLWAGKYFVGLLYVLQESYEFCRFAIDPILIRAESSYRLQEYIYTGGRVFCVRFWVCVFIVQG